MKFYKKLFFLLPMALLVACSSDTATPTNPPDGGSSSPSGGGGSGENGGIALPSTANASVPAAQYSVWKSLWLVSLKQEAAGGSTMSTSFFDQYPDATRVRWDGGDDRCEVTGLTSIDGQTFTTLMNKMTGCSVSEGIGYGMLIALFNDDKTTFDGLWGYNRGARKMGGSGLMPWQVVSFSRAISAVSALDADLDVATALILANYKWGNAAYLEDAKVLIDAIYQYGINQENKLIYPGPNWKTLDTYNPSYFSPVAFRLFASVDKSHPWEEVLSANYAYMKKVQEAGATKAIFPDWTNANGEAYYGGSSAIAKSSYMLYFQESVRIPWRIAWDYYWYADERAGTILKNLGDFVASSAGNDPKNLPKNPYNYQTGSLATDFGASGEHYLGAACLSGFGVNTAWTDNCTSYFNTFEMSSTAGYNGAYFKQILQMMFSSLLNGKFQKPNM